MVGTMTTRTVRRVVEELRKGDRIVFNGATVTVTADAAKRESGMIGVPVTTARIPYAGTFIRTPNVWVAFPGEAADVVVVA